MTDAESDVLVKAMKATVKRIAAENTWLRHSLMEMEARVAAMSDAADAARGQGQGSTQGIGPGGEDEGRGEEEGAGQRATQ